MISKELFNKFSFQDLLAYFFPGLAILIGSLVIVELLGFNSIFKRDLSAASGFLFLLLSFILGITLSGLSNSIENIIYKIKRKENPEHIRFIDKPLEDAINKKLVEFGFDVNILKSEDYYSICSIFVKETLPNAFAFSYRQEGLRLMRTYMMFPVLLWTGVGIIYGINVMINSKINGVLIICSSIICGLVVLLNLWDRMHKNRLRNVKNILLAFICIGKIKKLDI